MQVCFWLSQKEHIQWICKGRLRKLRILLMLSLYFNLTVIRCCLFSHVSSFSSDFVNIKIILCAINFIVRFVPLFALILFFTHFLLSFISFSSVLWEVKASADYVKKKNKGNSERQEFYFWQIKISFLCIILLSRTFFFPFILYLDTFKQQEFPFLQLFIFFQTDTLSQFCSFLFLLFFYLFHKTTVARKSLGPTV